LHIGRSSTQKDFKEFKEFKEFVEFEEFKGAAAVVYFDDP
jgi:hypothetical protein